MPAFRFAASATALIISAGIAPGSFSADAAVPGSFTILASQTTVMPHEAIGIRYQPGSMSGWSGDEYRELYWEIDCDDDSATFNLGGGPKGNNSARIIPFPSGVKAWSTPGTKTVTVSAYEEGRVLVAQETVSITVSDPSTYSWDVEIYHRPSGDWTGIPADNGTSVRRTSTWADVGTWDSMSSGGDQVRIELEDGATLNMDTGGTIANFEGNASGLIYIHNESNGASGTLQEWTRAVSSSTSGIVFSTGTTSSTRVGRFVCCGLDVNFDGSAIDSNYTASARTGVGLNWNLWFSQAIIESGATDPHMCFTGVRTKGAGNTVYTGGGISGSGNNPSDTGDQHTFFYDCDMNDQYDYHHLHVGGRIWAGMNGCRMLCDPHTSTGDPKGASDWMPDHAISLRWQNVFAGCVVNTYTAGGADWSGSNTPDYGIQETMRFVAQSNTDEAPQIVCGWVYGAGRHLFTYHDPNGLGIKEPDVVLADRCMLFAGRHFWRFCNIGAGNLRLINCGLYLSEVYSSALGSIATHIVRLADSLLGGETAGQSYCDFMTVYSDRDSTFGGTEAISETVTINGRSASEITFTGLAQHDPNHTSGSNLGSFSRADLFKPMTGNTNIIDQVTSGFRPVIDFEGNTRAVDGVGNTNLGMHDTSVASDAGVAAPTNSVAPSISENSAEAGFWLMDEGTWAASEAEAIMGPLWKYLWVSRWTVNGSASGDMATVYQESLYASSGTLDGDMAFGSIGGQEPTWVGSSNTGTL